MARSSAGPSTSCSSTARTARFCGWRLRDGRAPVEGPLGKESANFDHLRALDEVVPLFRSWMSDVAKRRHA